jgi:hypothetical protein
MSLGTSPDPEWSGATGNVEGVRGTRRSVPGIFVPKVFPVLIKPLEDISMKV